MNKRLYILPVLMSCFVAMLLTSSFSEKRTPAKNGTVTISFINTNNANTVVLDDSTYTNAFGEKYSISKLKYYISNLSVSKKNDAVRNENCYLVNAVSEQNNITLLLKPGIYTNIHFLLGVDSIKNCSGAQTGALDPINDMFWTWNSGYVMFKLEGNSASSPADLQRIEHHIGGYRNGNNVAKQIELLLPALHELKVEANSNTTITIETNLDHYWHGNNDIKISEIPVCSSTGTLAKKIASNFPGMFSIKNISSNH